jgi:hypothetical protein
MAVYSRFPYLWGSHYHPLPSFFPLPAMAEMGLEMSTPIGIAGYGCLGLLSASRMKRLEYFSVGGLMSSTSSHDCSHHTLPVCFVCHHIGSSLVNLHTTRYGGVRVMVAWRICRAASISIGCVRSMWLLIGTSLVSMALAVLQVLGDAWGLVCARSGCDGRCLQVDCHWLPWRDSKSRPSNVGTSRFL